MINALGLKPCKCAHRKYHCQCPKAALDLLRPAKRESLVTGDSFKLTPSPKVRRRRERGHLNFDEQAYRQHGLEHEAMKIVDHRESVSMIKGQSNMFVGTEEQKRLQRVDPYSAGGDNEYHGEF